MKKALSLFTGFLSILLRWERCTRLLVLHNLHIFVLGHLFPPSF